jgi:hypothetical protein
MDADELDRLRTGLERVLITDAIGPWFETPNRAFGGLKPIEVVERGEIDRLWRMAFDLESGQPM